MLKKLSGCQDVFCDGFDDLLCLFQGFPQVEFYKNSNKQFVAYNPETDTEFAFGASVDFGGIDGDTTYLIELKTGSAFGKNLETGGRIIYNGFTFDLRDISSIKYIN